MDRPTSQGPPYRSSTTFQLQQPGAAGQNAGVVADGRRSSAGPVTAAAAAAGAQRGSATAAGYQQGQLGVPVQPAPAARASTSSRQSAVPPAHRTSMLVQLQQPTAGGGSIVQPVTHSNSMG